MEPMRDDQPSDYSRPTYRRAYEASLEEAMALPEGELVHITTSMDAIACALRSTLPMIEALRPRVLAGCPHVDIAAYDALAHRWGALRYSHSLYQTAIDAPTSCADEASALRNALKRLEVHLQVMVFQQRIPALSERAQKFRPGHRELINKVLNTVVHIRGHWDQVAELFGMTALEIEAIEAQAERFDARVGDIRDRRPRMRKAAEVCKRMFALLLRSLVQVERAVEYLIEKPSDRAQYLPKIYAECGSWSKRQGQSPADVASTPEVNPGQEPLTATALPDAVPTARVVDTCPDGRIAQPLPGRG